MKRIAVAMFLLALVASVAGAQMMGGGGRMHPPTTGTIPGTGLGGMMDGFTSAFFGMAGGRGAMGPGTLIVTPSGNVIVTRAVDTNGDGVPEGELVALTPAGTKAWSKSLTGLGFLLGISNDVILTVVPPATIDPTRPLAATLVAYASASGVKTWELTVDGIPMAAQSFANGTYVTVVSGMMAGPAPGTRLGLMTTTLWAIDKGGVVLWKYDLKQ